VDNKEYEVTVHVSFNGHKITGTYTVTAPNEEIAKEDAEAFADVDIMISSGAAREKKNEDLQS